ncbi:MAG: SPFH domain-containing protein [Flavobacteriaceae bacterium]|nr:SPFH domain-containing protein [Flavobacteriaceae bacterium]
MILSYFLYSAILLTVVSSIVTIQQGSVAVITMFGKYSRILNPGLNFRVPFLEVIYRKISVQNRSIELDFQAITQDQANVYFKAMLLYSVFDNKEDTIKNVAFKFVNDRDFMTALIRTIEGSIRGFVATKKQAEILALRKEIVESVKEGIDSILESWGYHLIDLQLNDITFDEVITKSMAQVVASSNLMAAATNEGQALLITKTKAAEAEGNSIKISAEAERIAAQMRGQGIALFRKEVAKGMSDAVLEMKSADLDSSFLLFSMWTEAIKNFAADGKGNVIFLDGSIDGMNKTLKEMMAMNQIEANKGGKK